ncbi:hypothetical protein JG687_00014537 [Phytophthora cactorum]|uniref:Uncharacterized protein n=1 Tax=Phytophthora cactorum TaxID=29920 RepID=A0A8T1U1B9_9STRA|nr:hypothetical protein JG687_00014537 [Phytophthora cactorum]
MTGGTVFGMAAERRLHPHPAPQLETMMVKMTRVMTPGLAELLASVKSCT